MLKTKTVTVDGENFNIGSLSVRQFAALQDERKKLYGDAGTAEEIMAKDVPMASMLSLEANFIVVPSLNNYAKQNNQEPNRNGDEILDGMEHTTFRKLVNEIMLFMGLAVPAPGGATVAPGESQAAGT